MKIIVVNKESLAGGDDSRISFRVALQSIFKIEDFLRALCIGLEAKVRSVTATLHHVVIEAKAEDEPPFELTAYSTEHLCNIDFPVSYLRFNTHGDEDVEYVDLAITPDLAVTVLEWQRIMKDNPLMGNIQGGLNKFDYKCDFEGVDVFIDVHPQLISVGGITTSGRSVEFDNHFTTNLFKHLAKPLQNEE